MFAKADFPEFVTAYHVMKACVDMGRSKEEIDKYFNIAAGFRESEGCTVLFKLYKGLIYAGYLSYVIGEGYGHGERLKELEELCEYVERDSLPESMADIVRELRKAATSMDKDKLYSMSLKLQY